MSAIFHPRSCGPLAWWQWCRVAAVCAVRTPWEAWLMVGLGLVACGWVAFKWPGFTLPLIAVGLALRPVLHAWADRARQSAVFTIWDAWHLGRQAWPGWATGWVLGLILALGWATEVAVNWGSSGTMGRAWVVGMWIPFCFQPWGPVSFWGQLGQEKCPLHLMNRLQLEAVARNVFSLSLMAVTWFGVLGLLMVLGWLAPLAWAFWLMVSRSAFVDIFQGGLNVAARQKSPVGVSGVSRQAG